MVTIRTMAESDLPAVKGIEDVVFTDPWSFQQLREELEQKALAFVAEDEEGLVGYAFARPIIDQVEILSIAVARHKQGKGTGTVLLDYIIAYARTQGIGKAFLEVRVSNTAAINLYKLKLFQVLSTRKGYYSDGEDAFVMEKTIDFA
ncbi:MAG: ribosomal-protein-alanine N-acetyltransferase [Candidatus Raymondbacteria bacterium RifOxyA12_full_50_37]|uniref:[Ribosomal protein bS18]-alanine N-acetyltransferase n=1 Tax=Candidatus Raymondbacteria bacterium RIFOXYD12_FULL_49_13 TaxID=1817890 RepID=A0A1F7FCL8_UNCRA|nr:MAG: ribosomal-protein-alanine N-acetyltransferase [Candidatus Raymondbacteria bacterium RifOxyA12_full_50_37]OGJ86283.1 MAG: ribosomal-protein-alanine N-acetyltransferase [Candidatus Raymondbacteria bacterium RIFOXYA2_FULL_49_16]OGJ93613.1 MAG: ribosomal-protein-alanine N-acetyltransferase [Candidatus Raymondbacteria bacterium RifOxyC12_full_50_8]OGJ95820.1 MAG: ribosomal-protein-alanine N-acetyltransferase [Candidatus Raymondbacteria bacterium RIFOXYC2_FULL_50_21]OGK04388.1 MAG: ribosomal-